MSMTREEMECFAADMAMQVKEAEARTHKAEAEVERLREVLGDTLGWKMRAEGCLNMIKAAMERSGL